jgi:hypothetical protein
MIDRVVINTGAAAGSAGSATATGYSAPIAGEVLAVYIDYLDSPPAGTTDVTLSDESDPASEAIISISNAATDVKIYPRRVTELNDGTDVTHDGTNEVYAPYVVHGRLELTIAQANANDYIIATVWIRR